MSNCQIDEKGAFGIDENWAFGKFPMPRTKQKCATVYWQSKGLHKLASFNYLTSEGLAACHACLDNFSRKSLHFYIFLGNIVENVV